MWFGEIVWKRLDRSAKRIGSLRRIRNVAARAGAGQCTCLRSQKPLLPRSARWLSVRPMSQVITSLRHLPGDYALGLLTTHFTYRDYNRSSERIPGWRIYGLLEFEAPPSRLSPAPQR